MLVPADAEVVDLVNSLDYGLANSVWSSDLTRARRVAGQMVAGNGWINAHNVFAYGLPSTRPRPAFASTAGRT